MKNFGNNLGLETFEDEIRNQVTIAMEEADILLFVVDVTMGITDLDEAVADLARRSKKPVFVVVNKVDNNERISEASIFYEESNFESEAISASQIFNLIKHDNIDLMKINVEGAEYQILEELIDTKNISKIKNLQVQFHLFDEEENNNYNNLVQKLSETHELSWRFPFVWENWKLK
jgi:predicted GTPase